MGVLVLVDPVAGTTTDATQQASNNAALKAIINGGIDASNFAAGLIFNPNKIQQAAAAAGQGLMWDGAKWAPGQKITTSTFAGGPPASPADTDIWFATAVDANGTRWAFQYNAGSGSAYKWEFIGGMPVYIQDMNSRAVANVAVWTDWPVGMSMTVARAGEYDCTVEGDLQNTGGTPAVTLLGLSINGSDPVAKDNIENYSGATGPDIACQWTYYQKAIAANGIIKLRYQSQLTSTFTNAKASYIPRRIA